MPDSRKRLDVLHHLRSAVMPYKSAAMKWNLYKQIRKANMFIYWVEWHQYDISSSQSQGSICIWCSCTISYLWINTRRVLTPSRVFPPHHVLNKAAASIHHQTWQEKNKIKNSSLSSQHVLWQIQKQYVESGGEQLELRVTASWKPVGSLELQLSSSLAGRCRNKRKKHKGSTIGSRLLLSLRKQMQLLFPSKAF